jgi:hypothetical protein
MYGLAVIEVTGLLGHLPNIEISQSLGCWVAWTIVPPCDGLIFQQFLKFLSQLFSLFLFYFFNLKKYNLTIYQPFERLKGQAIDSLFYSQSIK